ncbi:MAG: hypothetical protein LBJ13_00330 [Puniceicoccales bacterium]|nr:hypothetical protein [Puniceicoccales bacterium]
MLENISSKNGKALLGIAFSFLLSNASLGAAGTRHIWTLEEDQILVEGVAIHGARNWEGIAKRVPGKTGHQCRERWMIISKPNPRRKRSWSKDEDQILMNARRRRNGWTAIAGQLSDRTPQQCRDRFLSLTTRQQRAAARLSAPSPAPADGDGAAVDGAVGLQPVRRCQQRVAVYMGPRPALPVPMVDQAGVAADGDGAAATGAVGPANPPPVRPPAPPPPSAHFLDSASDNEEFNLWDVMSEDEI